MAFNETTSREWHEVSLDNRHVQGKSTWMVQLQLRGHFSDQSLFLAELPAQLSIIFNPGENSTKADILLTEPS